MVGFFLKKNFCDIWDNFFPLFVSNILLVSIMVITGLGVSYVFNYNLLAGAGAVVAACGFIMSLIFAWGINARKIADFAIPGIKIFFTSLKTTWFNGFVFGSFIAIFFMVMRETFKVYIAMYFESGSITGLLIAALLGWCAFVTAAALQWFVPLYYLQEENSMVKCLKKCFILFFDNAMFTIGIFFHNIILLLLTVVTFGLVPGINGITVSTTNALRLRLYKYDWLEENDAFNDREKRGNIPWDELLEEDKESLGPRKLASFLFPWK